MIAAAPLLLLVCLAFEPPSAPTDEPARTRAEALERLRREKAGRASPPERAGWLERTLLAIEKAERPSLLDFNIGGVYPRVLGGTASGSRLAAGLRLWRPGLGGRPLDLQASAFHSLRGYELYDLQVGRIPHLDGQFPLRSTKGDDVHELAEHRPGTSRFTAYGSFRYRHHPRDGFFGLGEGSRIEDQVSFRFQDATYELVTGYEVGPRTVVNVRAGLRQVSLGRGETGDVPALQDRFDDHTAPGLFHTPDFVHVTTSLLLDRRDEPGNPHRGLLVGLSHTLFDDRGSDLVRFHRLAGDLRGFLPLGSPQRVFALRALVSRDAAIGGRTVPFYLQETLGGSRTLRGYDTFRFRGQKILVLQAEYRWEAAPALEFALFADAGKAAGADESLGLDRLHTDYGLGVRLKTFDSVLVRFDVARSREETRVFLRFSPSY